MGQIWPIREGSPPKWTWSPLGGGAPSLGRLGFGGRLPWGRRTPCGALLGGPSPLPLAYIKWRQPLPSFIPFGPLALLSLLSPSPREALID